MQNTAFSLFHFYLFELPMERVEEFVLRCIKYHHLGNAIHAVLAVHEDSARDYSVLLGFLLMKNGEHRRALSYLLPKDCLTSNYYKALCYQELTEYENAKVSLERILMMHETKGPAPSGEAPQSELGRLYALEYERALVLDRLAHVLVLNGECESAARSFGESMLLNPLQYCAHKFLSDEGKNEAARHAHQELMDENTSNVFSTKSEEKSASPGTAQFVQRMNKTIKELISKIGEGKPAERDSSGKKVKTVKLSLPQEAELDEPGEAVVLRTLLAGTNARRFVDTGSFDLLGTSALARLPLTVTSDIAVHMFESGYVSRAAYLFEHIRTRDKYFLQNMHYYSSVLWHQREKRILGILCRDLLGIDQKSHVTWASLGNYFSLQMEHDKAITCFERSLAIEKDHYVMCLLGHELIINSDLTDGLKYFLESLKMKNNNYSALTGCGMIYEKITKWDNAEYCFMNAIKCKPRNVMLSYLVLQFLIGREKLAKAYELFRECMGIEKTLDELRVYICKNEAWQDELKRAASRNEQVRPLFDSLFLELALIYATLGEKETASRIIRALESDGPLHNTKKAKIALLINGKS